VIRPGHHPQSGSRDAGGAVHPDCALWQARTDNGSVARLRRRRCSTRTAGGFELSVDGPASPWASTHAFQPCKALVRRWCHSNPILFGLLNAAESRRSRRFLLIRAERLPVRGTPIFTGHKHDERLVAPPDRATDGTHSLALRVELRALAGGRIYQMSGRHMLRAVNGSLAGVANVCSLQWGSANICWRVSRRIYSPLVRRTNANAGLNDSTSACTLRGQLLASWPPSH
jgi:hypothetical protein